VESMTRVPMMGFNPLPNPLLQAKVAAYISMGDTAENVASKWHISREEQEAFAVRSQQRAAAAVKAGHLAGEIVPITTKSGTVDGDGCIRPDTNAAALAQLKPAFSQNGTVTAGTSSPLTDAGCAPDIMGIGPVAATLKALQRARLEMSSIDVVELNEAFASQALACARDLGIKDATLNLDGGAIALGHPLGATGARIVGKAASLLQRVGGRYALATQCIGGGQGIATILERI
jgi:acetyl-CoA acyltransferase